MTPESVILDEAFDDVTMRTLLNSYARKLSSVVSWEKRYEATPEKISPKRKAIIQHLRTIVACLNTAEMELRFAHEDATALRAERGAEQTRRYIIKDGMMVKASLEEYAAHLGKTPEEVVAEEEQHAEEYFSDPRNRYSVIDELEMREVY